MQRKIEKTNKGSSSALPFGKYNMFFEILYHGEKRNLSDKKSDKNSYLPIIVNEDEIYVTQPDGKIIPAMKNQRKCDFLMVCPEEPQVYFAELKGENISSKEKENPYDQIYETICFMEQDVDLKMFTGQNVEKHAFIVSPGRQKLPKGIESCERKLWRKLAQSGSPVHDFSERIHHVKVTHSERFSNKGTIICSSKSPVPVPLPQ